MRKYGLYSTLLFFLIAASCIYSENGTYYHYVTPGEPPEINIFTNLDTIEASVVDSFWVHYEVDVIGGEFIWTRFLLSDSIIFDSDTAISGFWLKPYMVSEAGMHTLTMESYYSTNTGSIADEMGIEAFLESTLYDIFFYE